MEEQRSVVVLFVEATIKAPPSTWRSWHGGPLKVDGFDGKSELPSRMWSAVVGSSRTRRWHLDLPEAADVGKPSKIISIEAMELAGTSNTGYLLAIHLAMKAVDRSDFEGMARLGDELQQLASVAQVEMTLRNDWGADTSMPGSAIVAELICIPDNTQAFLPPPRFNFSPLNVMPGHLEMFSVITDIAEEPMVSADIIEAASEQVVQVPGGEVMVGLKRSVAMSDFGVEAYSRTCVVDAFYVGLAQRVLLRRLTDLSERLSDPGRHARDASELSRAIAGYQGVYSWAHTDSPSPLNRVLIRYRGLSGASETEQQLQVFAASAQTEISGETNVLLALLTVLGFGVAVAAAVATGAAWKGWDVLWGVAVAAITFAALLFLPFSRALRQSLFAFPRRH
jgi:hypothetical protein